MTAVVIVIAICVLAGYSVAARVEESREGRLGLAFLLGAGLVALATFALSIIPGGWNRIAFFGVVLAGTVVLRLRVRPIPLVATPRSKLALIATVFIGIIVAGHALFATAAAPVEIDFLENWGLKAKIFWFAGGVDWRWLTSEAILQNHPDYPLLVPMLYDAVAIVAGGWDDRSLGLLSTAFGLSLVMVSSATLRREFPTRPALTSLALIALTPLAMTPWIGLADGPFLAYAACGAHLLDRGRRGDSKSLMPAALLLGFAALTKNEGVAFIAAAAVGLAAANAGRLAARLWPAVALALLWIVPRTILGLATDLGEGTVVARFVAHLLEPAVLVKSLAQYTAGRTLLGLSLLVAFLVAGAQIVRTERFRITTAVVQLVFYVAAYLATPHDLAWHVRWSWERLLSHVSFLLVFAVICGVLAWLSAGEENREARDSSRSDPTPVSPGAIS